MIKVSIRLAVILIFFVEFTLLVPEVFYEFFERRILFCGIWSISFSALLPQVFALVCNFHRFRRMDQDFIVSSEVRNASTCEGDYCYIYAEIFEIGYDLGCIKGTVVPSQCWTDRSGTVCVCSTDLCNTPENRAVGTRHELLDCLGGQYNYVEGKLMAIDEDLKPVPPEKLFYKGYVCQAYGQMTNYGRKNVAGSLDRQEDRFTGSFMVRSGMRNAGPGQFTPFYYGGFYITEYSGNLLQFFGRCRTPLCNNWTIDMVHRKGVKCKARELYSPEPGPFIEKECEGQMCGILIYYSSLYMATMMSKFCFSQNATLAEYPITVGHYRNVETENFDLQDFYLCNEDYCNKNIETANKSVESYQKMHPADLKLVRNPLYTGTGTPTKSFLVMYTVILLHSLSF